MIEPEFFKISQAKNKRQWQIKNLNQTKTKEKK